MPGTFNVGSDYGIAPDDDFISADAYWIIAVIRLGFPLSFSRQKMASVTKDLTFGALTRAVKPLVITDDCMQMSIQNSKKSPTKNLSATLKQTDVNYLTEILPGDHVLAWIVNSPTKYKSLLDRIEKPDGTPASACNKFDDGLKFVGRVHSIRKTVQVSGQSGIRTSSYSLQCFGFSELNTQMYYDNNLASQDVLKNDLGQWMARLGIEYQQLFADDATTGIKKNNINLIVPTLLDLIVGRGPTKRKEINVDAADGKTISATAPYSYTIPLQVGKLLGAEPESGEIMAYADILELLQGVQSYPNTQGYQVFIPAHKTTRVRRRVSPTPMLGTFLPFFMELTNIPLWSLLSRYLNPTINELFTALRVNPEGNIMPTIVMRQIPFTSECFDPDVKDESDNGQEKAFGPQLPTPSTASMPFTRHVSGMPRWGIPAVMIKSVDLGRSDATRFNFIHVYGQSSKTANNNSVPNQMVLNPPVRDDLDIIRSGLRPYMTTVECWVSDTVGKVPTAWMKLIADSLIGSHLTLNGTITCLGIQSPICEGDNLLFDGVVYHIEGVSHQVGIDMMGHKAWSTSIQLTNGMRANGATDDERMSATKSPIYPGLRLDDNTQYDPGLSLEHRATSGGESAPNQDYPEEGDSPAKETARSEGPTQLAPPEAKKPTKRSKRAKK
ncbi:MAG: hypothetical protein H0U23_15085 [Blastocatellia bacterium]|nr:hypothetical protein [Blastocatellia bacterium]